MVKKVKRFVIFLLFSFFSYLVSGKSASATSSYKVCVVPKDSSDKLVYNGGSTNQDAKSIDNDCQYD